MSETFTYTVPAIHCGHCAMTIEEELGELDGVEDVRVDVDAKRVSVRAGEGGDEAVRRALADVGYPAD